jgi:hypothetical protein
VCLGGEASAGAGSNGRYGRGPSRNGRHNGELHPAIQALETIPQRDSAVHLNRILKENQLTKRIVKDRKLDGAFAALLVKTLSSHRNMPPNRMVVMARAAFTELHDQTPGPMNNGQLVQFLRVVEDWWKHHWDRHHEPPVRKSGHFARGPSALTSEILDAFKLEAWLLRRGPYVRYEHVAAHISLDRINSTQPIISDMVRPIGGGLRIPFWDVVDHMWEHGFDNMGAPDVVPVRTTHGKFRFATFDHRRLVAAREAGIKEVLAAVHRPGALVPTNFESRSVRTELAIGNREIHFWSHNLGGNDTAKTGDRPQTWGDAVTFCCRNMAYQTGRDIPDTGIEGLPQPPVPRPWK